MKRPSDDGFRVKQKAWNSKYASVFSVDRFSSFLALAQEDTVHILNPAYKGLIGPFCFSKKEKI